jgi:very-short-patch-repair endonuclease
MGIIYNRAEQKPFRQYLRGHSTRAEITLWKGLKERQMLGYKFRRQHGVGRFILDFYCPKLRLAIEVDGASHDSLKAQQRDKVRQVEIEKHWITVLRFRDEEVLGNVALVIDAIEREIRKLRGY